MSEQVVWLMTASRPYEGEEPIEVFENIEAAKSAREVETLLGKYKVRLNGQWTLVSKEHGIWRSVCEECSFEYVYLYPMAVRR